MASLEEIRDVRLKKIELLKEAGKDPYPSHTNRTHTIAEALADFEALESAQEVVTLSGRVMSLRAQGALIFANFSDGTETFQMLLKKDEPTEATIFDLFFNTVDIGEFVEVTRTVFITNRGQKTILVTDWKMLTKTLAPLPEKWAGITDADERYRKRYLDILMDPELKDMFYKKSKFWEVTRTFIKRERIFRC